MTGAPSERWSDDPLLGELVADRFAIRRVLGEGGIGRVYEAVQIELDRTVALKVLHDKLGRQPDMKARFQREARAASMLIHPGSVVVHDYGQWHDRFFIAMEHIEGVTLTDALKRSHPFEVARIVNIMTQLCNVLEVAHQMQLLHRDLKPDNILLTRDRDGRERVKVVDFGLAILLEEIDNVPRLTMDGTISGTPGYMSPEQALERSLDARSDLYSLGCVFYECLVGAPPFDADSVLEVLSKHLYDEPVSPNKRARHEIDRGLELICLWALRKRPEDRPRSAAELREAIEEAVARMERGETADDPMAFDGLLAREERASAAGIAPSRPMMRVVAAPQREVIVVEDEPTIERSGAAMLRAHGMRCRVSRELDLLPAGAHEADVVVVDLHGFDRTAAIGAIARWVDQLGPGIPVLAIGDDDDIDAMSGALRAGADDYAPASELSRLPAKVRDALRRARRFRGDA